MCVRLALILPLLTSIPVSTSAQISDTTENGRRVLLYEDGSWSYAEQWNDNVTYIHTDDEAG